MYKPYTHIYTQCVMARWCVRHDLLQYSHSVHDSSHAHAHRCMVQFYAHMRTDVWCVMYGVSCMVCHVWCMGVCGVSCMLCHVWCAMYGAHTHIYSYTYLEYMCVYVMRFHIYILRHTYIYIYTCTNIHLCVYIIHLHIYHIYMLTHHTHELDKRDKSAAACERESSDVSTSVCACRTGRKMSRGFSFKTVAR